MGIILVLVAVIIVLVLDFGEHLVQNKIFQWLRQRWEHQLGSRIMVALLTGIIVHTIITDRVPNPAQKIPLVIVCLLLIWANLFLNLTKDK